MRYAEAEKKLKAAGCYWIRDGKRHPIWRSPITGKFFELGFHRSEEIKQGTKKSIERESGVKF